MKNKIKRNLGPSFISLTIGALEKILGLLRIIKEYVLNENRITELGILENMSTVSTLTPIVLE